MAILPAPPSAFYCGRRLCGVAANEEASTEYGEWFLATLQLTDR